jgi:hypothetical protein
MPDETEDQERLRTICDELDAILKKYDVGGVVLIASTESAAWLHNVPTWSSVVDTDQGLAVKFKPGPILEERIERTMHLLGCLRDMAADSVNIYGRLFRVARHQLRAVGGLMFEVENIPERRVSSNPFLKTN